jgi:hypothetical protein
MSPVRLARKEPNLCDTNTLDMAGYRCIFWGSLTGPGVTKEKERLLRYEMLKVSSLRNRGFYFFSEPTLILMGAWLQINEGSMPYT